MIFGEFIISGSEFIMDFGTTFCTFQNKVMCQKRELSEVNSPRRMEGNGHNF